MVEGMQENFNKGELRFPRNAAKEAAEIEVASDSTRGKILCAEI